MFWTIFEYITVSLFILYCFFAVMGGILFSINLIFKPNFLLPLNKWTEEHDNILFGTFILSTILIFVSLIAIDIHNDNNPTQETYNVTVNDDADVITVTRNDGKTYVINLPDDEQ